jgi:uncharacterized SAM-binding protein YcdF (DUF218 family)
MSPSPRARASIFRRRPLLILACSFLALLIVAWIFRAPLLKAMARFWIVDEPIGVADAVVILGGGLQSRPFAAARFVEQGLTTNVLLMCPLPNASERRGTSPGDCELSRAIMLKKGVPDIYIHFTGTNVTSTFDEARAIRVWASEHHPKVLLIPTDVFHTRRVKWLLQKQLDGLDVDVRVIALEDEYYSRTNWWQNERGFLAFQNEAIKYVLYRWRY